MEQLSACTKASRKLTTVQCFKTHEVEAKLSALNVLLKIYLAIKTCLSLSETVKYKALSENSRLLTTSASQTKDSAKCPT